MSKTLYLVRHGRTLFNDKGIIQGWIDSPLTELGIEQARRVGSYFERKGVAFDHAYSSTLTRTQDTLANIVDMPFDRLPGLREWGFGEFEGERASLMPELPWGDFYRQFGGETQDEVRERMYSTLSGVMERADHACVLAVSSGSSCREFLGYCAVKRGEAESMVLPGNCSIMRLEYADGLFELKEVVEQGDMERLLGED